MRGDRKQQQQAYDKRRDMQPWRAWYRTARWQQRREAQLQAEPLCRYCRRKGIITAATVADHVHRHRGQYEAFWCGPLQSLCASCHSSEKRREENAEERV